MLEITKQKSFDIEAHDFQICEPWQQCLLVLLNDHPQIIKNRIKYIVEGGAAVSLLQPNKRLFPPKDIDLLYFDEELPKEIQISDYPWCDGHTINQWLLARRIPYTSKGVSYLTKAYRSINLNGNHILVLDPVVLAASKTYEYEGKEIRPLDLCDIVDLNVTQKAISLARKKISGK